MPPSWIDCLVQGRSTAFSKKVIIHRETPSEKSNRDNAGSTICIYIYIYVYISFIIIIHMFDINISYINEADNNAAK